jgi:hypothetical protein
MAGNTFIRSILALSAFVIIGSHAAMAQQPAQRVSNQYCAVNTYIQPGISDVAMALPLPRTGGKPVILLNEQARSLPHFAYVLAHECCHHTLNHTQNMPQLHSRDELMELEREADRCAASLLQERGEFQAIHAAIDTARREGQWQRAEKISQSLQSASRAAYGFE